MVTNRKAFKYPGDNLRLRNFLIFAALTIFQFNFKRNSGIMFNINVHSVLLILGINKLLLAFLLLFLRKENPNLKAIKYWSDGSFITSAGLLIYAFMPHSVPVWIDFTYSFLLNVFVLTGDALFLAGFWLIKDKPFNKKIMVGFPVLAAINVIVFTLFYDVLWIRYSLNAFLGASLYFVSALELRTSPRKSLDHIFKITSGIYLFFTLLQLTRGILAIIVKPVDPVYESLVSVVLIAIAGVAMIFITFNLIVIITTILNDDLSEEIRSKNKLYAIISHDLRGPLGNLFNYVQLLKTKQVFEEDEVRKKYVDEMARLSSSSRFLLENLLNWSKGQLNEINVQLQESSLTTCVLDNLAMMKSYAEGKNIQFIFDEKETINAVFDSDMMGIVIRNLLTNAVKFTPKNGTIRMSILQNDHFVELNVEDNGVGMKQDKLEQIFDRKLTFSTPGTDAERGSGFGLILCKEFIALNNGAIRVSSVPGRGSVFTLSLPKQN